MSIPSLLVVQALTSILLFIVPALIIARIRSRKPLQWLHWKAGTKMNWKIALTAAGIMIVAQPLINWFSYWNQQIVLPDSLAALEAYMKQTEEERKKEKFSVSLSALKSIKTLSCCSQEIRQCLSRTTLPSRACATSRLK